MPTTRTRRTRGQAAPVPGWLSHFLKTGEVPEDCTPDAHEFSLWQLIAGWYCYDGRNWPDPNTVRQPERLPRAFNECE